MIVAASGVGATNINLIIATAARYKLPAVYIQRAFVAAGGLISYGPNFDDQYRSAAATLIAYYGARNPLIFRCKPQANTNSS